MAVQQKDPLDPDTRWGRFVEANVVRHTLSYSAQLIPTAVTKLGLNIASCKVCSPIFLNVRRKYKGFLSKKNINFDILKLGEIFGCN